jgi:hypothetical protein
METAHKRPKEGNILFSGGRDGPADVIEYQTCVLSQLYQNEIYNIWDKGNQIKNKRQKLAHSEDSELQAVKRRKVVVNIYVTFHGKSFKIWYLTNLWFGINFFPANDILIDK